MDRTEFKKRMLSLKSYQELNPNKGYWDWKVELFDEGGELSDDEKIIINRAWAKKVMRDAEAAIEMERGTRQIEPMPLRSFSELLEDSERRREQARRESGIEGLKNIVRGFNRTAGTAASLASLIAGGGWALTRLLSGNRATSLGRVLAPGVIPANTADTAADAVDFVVDPSLSGAAEVGAGIVLGKWKNFGSKARQATELAGLSLNANNAIESYFDGDKVPRTASNYHEAKDGDISQFRSMITKLLDDLEVSTGIDVPTALSNCTLTATLWVNPKAPLMKALTIIDNGELYGYYEIPEEYAVPGDLIIATNPDNNAHHTMYLLRFADKDYKHDFMNKNYNIPKGHPIVKYSNGNSNPSGYRENIGLLEYIDNSHGKTKVLYFRYVKPGTKEVLLPEITVTPKNNIKLNFNTYFNNGRVR